MRLPVAVPPLFLNRNLVGFANQDPTSVPKRELSRTAVGQEGARGCV
jgi:hypothetical protein